MLPEFPLKPQYTMAVNQFNWPERYDHPIEEYNVLVDSAGLLDFGLVEWLCLRGNDTESFLQGMVSQDVHQLKIGDAASSLKLDTSGKTEALIHLYRRDENTYYLQTPPGLGETIRGILDRYIIMEDVTLSVMSEWYTASLQGAAAGKRKDQIAGRFPLVLWVPHDRCGFGGYDLLLPVDEATSLLNEMLDLGVRPVGMTALNIARVEAFIPWFGVELEVGGNPLVCGKGDRISYTKGCYIGQETVAMTRDRGRPPQLLVWLKGRGGGIPETGTSLRDGEKTVGLVASGIFSPKWEAPVCTAFVKYAAAKEGNVLRDEAGEEWAIEKVVEYKMTDVA